MRSSLLLIVLMGQATVQADPKEDMKTFGELLKSGVTFDFDGSGTWTFDKTVTDAVAQRLKDLKSVPCSGVRLVGKTAMTPAGLKELYAGKTMWRLDIIGFSLTDEWLATVKELKDVKEFNFLGSNLGDAELKELKGLNNVQSLGLWGTKVTDAGLKELKGWKKLTSLNASETAITPAGIKELTELESVDLSGTKLRDLDLKELKALQKLSHLGLRGTLVTDDGLKHLLAFPQLQSLDVQRTAVSARGLKQLQPVKTFRSVWIDASKLNGNVKAELKESMPRLWINPPTNPWGWIIKK